MSTIIKALDLLLFLSAIPRKTYFLRIKCLNFKTSTSEQRIISKFILVRYTKRYQLAQQTRGILILTDFQIQYNSVSNVERQQASYLIFHPNRFYVHRIFYTHHSSSFFWFFENFFGKPLGHHHTRPFQPYLTSKYCCLTHFPLLSLEAISSAVFLMAFISSFD